MPTEFRAVEPVQPAAGYIAGKRHLSRRLVEQIEVIHHDAYAEPFVGMGGVFLRRRSAPRSETINDISGDVATFFRVLQRHYTHFMEMLRFQIASRREFERLIATDPETLTDLERAARFLYLQRLAFGGKVVGRNFGVSTTQGARFNVAKLAPVLEGIHERLTGVVIEQLPWRRFIDRYDRPGMLFYCDPPYWGSEDDYGRGAFAREELAELAARLRTIKGSFLLSINDRPEVRALLEGMSIETVTAPYSISQSSRTHFGELIVRPTGKGPSSVF